MIEFEQTFRNFLMDHQEKHNRTYHFLILMDAIITAAKRIELYYRTGALKGNLGMAGSINVQGEDVMKMDDIAHEIVAHYLDFKPARHSGGKRGVRGHYRHEQGWRPLFRVF